MSDATYNGWKNKETWATNLWLSNDQQVYINLNNTIASNISEDSTKEEIAKLFRTFAETHLPDEAKEEIGNFDLVDWVDVGYWWIDEMEL